MNLNEIDFTEPVTMYKASDASDRILEWTVLVMDGGLSLYYGQLHGQLQHEYVEIPFGKANRSQYDQMILEAQSRVKNQWDKSYRFSIDDAKRDRGKNALGHQKPMLAQRWDKVKNVDYRNAFVQYKLNGHRCLIANHDGEYHAYSRNGQPIRSIDHILEGLDFPEGHTIDGELYHHGSPIQFISSLVRKPQLESERLEFHCYDVVMDERFTDRNDWIAESVTGNESFVHHPSSLYYEDTLDQDLSRAISEGYEGLIIRLDDYPYQVGKRSKGLIKVKAELDAEFGVIDVEPSRGRPVMTCIMGNGDTFKVTAPGNEIESADILENKDNYIGKTIQVRFAEWTVDKKPFHPVAVRFREV